MRTNYLLLFSCLLFFASSLEASVVAFRSGNGDPPVEWTADSLVRFKPWQTDAVANIPTTQDFTDVRTSDTVTPKSHAAIIAPQDTNGWGTLPADETALPVFNFVAGHVYGVGSSALFGIPIAVEHVEPFNTAQLDFSYVVDNYLGYVEGELVVEGLYLGTPGNEVALEGTVNYTPYDPSDPDNTRFMSAEVSLDVSGIVTAEDTYWLYMNVTDRGVAASGILFGGTITTSHAPEPATAIVWSVLGLASFGIIRWRRRKKV